MPGDSPSYPVEDKEAVPIRRPEGRPEVDGEVVPVKLGSVVEALEDVSLAGDQIVRADHAGDEGQLEEGLDSADDGAEDPRGHLLKSTGLAELG